MIFGAKTKRLIRNALNLFHFDVILSSFLMILILETMLSGVSGEDLVRLKLRKSKNKSNLQKPAGHRLRMSK